MSGRTRCKFYDNGNCKNGRNCNFLHIDDNNNRYNNSNNNRYGNNNNNRYNNSNNGRNNQESGTIAFPETPSQFVNAPPSKKAEELVRDMNEFQNHEVLLTSYSLPFPAKTNLIPERDFSFEEQRLLHYQLSSENRLNEYMQQIGARKQDMLKCVKFIKDNSLKAARYAQLSVDKQMTKPLIEFQIDFNAPLPNNSSPFGSSMNSNPFGSSNSSSNPFGAQTSGSPFGSTSNPFAPASSSPFGSSSGGAFAKAGAGAFANAGASSMTSSTPAVQNPFGGSSSTGSGSGFGKSGFGFGTSSTTGGSGFGKSGFGSNSTSSNAFGASATTTANPFGASSTTTSNPFGASATTTSNPFGASSTSTANPFGASSNSAASSSPFGTSSSAKPNPFGASSGSSFGSSGFGKSGFGAFANQNASAANKPLTNAASSTSAFGGVKPSTSSPFGSLNSSTGSNNVFGQAQTQTQTQSQQNTTSSFGNLNSQSTASGAASGNAFGSFTNKTPETTQPNVFGAAATTAPANTATNTFVPTEGNDDGPAQPLRYKQADIDEEQVRVSQLGADFLEAFKAVSFTMGKIPDCAPPMELCG